MFCTNCGHPITEDWTFCKHCGDKICEDKDNENPDVEITNSYISSVTTFAEINDEKIGADKFNKSPIKRVNFILDCKNSTTAKPKINEILLSNGFKETNYYGEKVWTTAPECLEDMFCIKPIYISKTEINIHAWLRPWGANEYPLDGSNPFKFSSEKAMMDILRQINKVVQKQERQRK